jgi:hypothetical protein
VDSSVEEALAASIHPAYATAYYDALLPEGEEKKQWKG